MATAWPSEFRLTPARAGLNAVAVPQGRNIQAGTAILNRRGFEIDVEVFVLSIVTIFYGIYFFMQLG
jgi:hypothetical protein